MFFSADAVRCRRAKGRRPSGRGRPAGRARAGRPEWSGRASSFPPSKGPNSRGYWPIGCSRPSRRRRATGCGSARKPTSASAFPPESSGRGGLEYAATITGMSELRNQIALAVTERGIHDNSAVATLEAASRSGVRIALDDVTLGRTHLAVPSRYTLDVIKTDRSLINQVAPECPLVPPPADVGGSRSCGPCTARTAGQNSVSRLPTSTAPTDSPPRHLAECLVQGQSGGGPQRHRGRGRGAPGRAKRIAATACGEWEIRFVRRCTHTLKRNRPGGSRGTAGPAIGTSSDYLSCSTYFTTGAYRGDL